MLKKNLYYWTVVSMQIIGYLLLVLPLRLYYRARRQLPQNLDDLRKGTLIVSNHQSKADAFFVLVCIPFRKYVQILPIRTPLLDKYYYSPWYNPKIFPILTLFGSFPVGETPDDRMQAMFYIRSLLKQGTTVLIFPEGKIMKGKDVGKLQQGIDFFTKVASQIVFVRIQGLNGIYHESYKRDRACRVVFSDVFLQKPAMELVDMRQYLDKL